MDYIKKRIPYTIIIVSALLIIALISYFVSEKKSPASKNVKTVSAITPLTGTHTETFTIKSGDTFATFIRRLHLSETVVPALMQSTLAKHYLMRLDPGNTLQFSTDASHLDKVVYTLPNGRSLEILPKNNAWIANINQEPMTKTVRYKSSIIHHSLAAAERNAGLTESMSKQLNAMFATQHISGDIHPGDRLEVLYHEYFLNNKKNHPGHIVAAEIVGKKDDFRVVRYTPPHHVAGYYKANGQGTKPEFLKIPLHYRRIGSYFNYNRMDPILHKVRPHLAVDFDAPMGTPVKAIGDGMVIFCKQVRGYGNTVMIQYNRSYKTLYAHLEKFAVHMKSHERVKKGEVVGYVGRTGWTTGPHLHFALYKNGIPINPLTVHFPTTSAVPEAYRQAFLYKENRWFSEMKLFESVKEGAKKKA